MATLLGPLRRLQSNSASGCVDTMALLLPPGMREIRLLELRKLKTNEPKMMEVPDTGDELMLLKEADGQVRAIDNRCPHKRAKLSKGDIEDLGEQLGGLCIRCPKHRRKFAGGLYVSLLDGQCRTKTPTGEKAKDKQVNKWSVRVHQTRIDEQGFVHVRVPIPESSSSSASSNSSNDNDCQAILGSRETTQCAGEPKLFEAVLSKISPRQDSSGDVFVFHFQLKNASSREAFVNSAAALGVADTPWHIWLKQAGVKREYTPISTLKDIAQTGTFALLIKIYNDGEMSKQLRAAQVGTTSFISVPEATLEPSMWPVAAQLSIRELWRKVATGSICLGLICAGTGITPCMQVLEFVVEAIQGSDQRRSRRQVAGLLTSNRRGAGPLMLAELTSLQGQAPVGSITVRHTLTDEPEPTVAKRLKGAMAKASAVDVTGNFDGRVSIEMLKATLPPPAIAADRDSKPCLVVVTGPAGFAEHCLPLLVALGHPKELVVILDA